MHATDSPVFLIGYRGTGKTSVARELAARLNRDWIDADDLIEQQAGKSIAKMFADNGEAAFRDLEAKVVEDLSRTSGAIISLGGGAVLRESNRRAICDAGPVVWLTASIDSIVARLASDAATASRRPNLTSAGGRDEIESLLNQRRPLYRECATLIVDTEGKTVAQVADEIAAQL